MNTAILEAGRKTEDYALLQEIQRGSEAAFNRLVNRYKNRLFNFVLRMVRTREEAEDLVQETFLRVFQHKNNFDPAYSFSTWIFTIALNLARNFLRRGRKVKFLELLELEETSEEPTVQPFQAALSPWLEKEIEKLPPRYKAPFLLREVEELSYEEVAEVTGLPTGTVKSRVSRARMMLAKNLRPKKEKLEALANWSPGLGRAY
ncbi:MAG: sigma-70 family RNA polymerase sigma factor [candidate division Zixibacteria bacterium]|nr:sigma-70 family RNA polymerase sigma factor [candidate division Zixibacteria bacterium]